MLRLVLTIWLLGAASVEANGADPLTLGTADLSRGWEAVGRVDTGTDAFCTGALITPEIVLTAAHCVHDARTGGPLPPDRVSFQAGFRFGRPEALRGLRRIVLHPAYGTAHPDRLARIGVDLALLELDSPVRLGHVRPFRMRSDVLAGEDVSVVSYAQDRAAAPSRHEACRVLTRDTDVLVLGCTVDHGASGAPVFAVAAGEARIVSVISAKATWRGRSVALATAIGTELDVLLAEFARAPTFAPVGKMVRPPAPGGGG